MKNPTPARVILDGAMGTMLQAAGLPAGYPPELWNMENPQAVTAVAAQYVAAGSDVIYANTFGANRRKLGDTDVATVVRAGVAAARAAAAGTDVRVALDVGPIGQMLEPLGTLPFAEAYDIFREVVLAGADAGADLVVFETMSDLREVKAAVLAAKENTDLPVWVTMTYEKSGRTFLGTTVPAMALTLSGLGVDALGFNCSLGPRELLPMVRELSEWCDTPILLKPNAGLPDPASGVYRVTPEQFAEEMAEAAALGVMGFGGCCGTTPAFVAALRARLADLPPVPRPPKKYSGVASGTCAVSLGGVRVIGERINPSGKKRFQAALREGDIAYILNQGILQQDAGADILDVNVGLPGIDEVSMMETVVRELQAVSDLPLQIDSSNPAAIEAGLRIYCGKPIVNSVNGDDDSLDAILPLCKKYGAAVVALTMDRDGIPETAEARIRIARRILDRARDYGIPAEDVIVDCLTLTVSAQQSQARETLRALRYVHGEMGLATTLGVSNISFGLPARPQMTAAFLTEALACGLTLPIVNPATATVMDAIVSHRALSGEDAGCAAYIARFSEVEEAGGSASGAYTLQDAILRGLREETANLTRAALETADPLSVVDTELIPALNRVGHLYETQKIFLPQLMSAASAAAAGFDAVRARVAATGGQSIERGRILVATVEGDNHDIGKNIVRTVLENYGYRVTDLGRNVPAATVVETAVREDIHLIGLSALMTTTVPRMAETIRALRESGHPCKIWVGGAVLTADYAREIGADYYAADAGQSADIAASFFAEEAAEA